MAKVISGVGAGAYGALGGSISFEWDPDPEIIAQRILALAGYLENFIPPLTASRMVAIGDMQMHFDTESGPMGAWAPLSEEYVKTTRGGAAHPILQLSGAMHDAAVNPASYPIDAHDLFFDTSLLTAEAPYWPKHEEGREMEFSQAVRDQRKRSGLKAPKPGWQFEGDGGMPPRPFLGLSESAEIQIIEVFDAWFQGGVSGFYSRPSGKIQSITPRGFGPMVTTGFGESTSFLND